MGSVGMSTSSAPPEVLEAVVAAGPAVAATVAPLVAAFARLAGLRARRARALAEEVAALVARACRRAGPVRLRLHRRPRLLRVFLRCGKPLGTARARVRAGAGWTLERPGSRSLVLNVPGPFVRER